MRQNSTAAKLLIENILNSPASTPSLYSIINLSLAIRNKLLIIYENSKQFLRYIYALIMIIFYIFLRKEININEKINIRGNTQTFSKIESIES